MSLNSTDPATLFGGTWQRIKGRFLLGADEETYPAGSSGGEVDHTLTVEEMPSHKHTFRSAPLYNSEWVGGSDIYAQKTSFAKVYLRPTTPAGEGQPHNNMPPYLVVYMWTRIE